MLAHFAHLHTPLPSLTPSAPHRPPTYPTIPAQLSRFRALGWYAARATTLWALWRSEAAVRPEVRRAVEAAEPFDEWEELALFAGHYFVLHAETGAAAAAAAAAEEAKGEGGGGFVGSIPPDEDEGGLAENGMGTSPDVAGIAPYVLEPAAPLGFDAPDSRPRPAARRFGAAFALSAQGRELTGGGSPSSDYSVVVHHGGAANGARPPSADAYGELAQGGWGPRPAREEFAVDSGDDGRAGREKALNGAGNGAGILCHTITALALAPTADRREEPAHLLVGGRRSPTDATGECWLRRAVRNRDDNGKQGDGCSSGRWARAAPIFPSRYRHCAARVRVAGRDCVLVFGGRTGDGSALADWQVWSASSSDSPGWEGRWHPVEVAGLAAPGARFGAAMAVLPGVCDRDTGGEGVRCRGVLIGGVDGAGREIYADAWLWELGLRDDGCFMLECGRIARVPRDVARLGAALVPIGLGADRRLLLLIGGVGRRGVLVEEDEVLALVVRAEGITAERLRGRNRREGEGMRPLLVGCAAVARSDEEVVLLGGGAVCFSFGNFENPGLYTIRRENEADRGIESAAGAGSLGNLQGTGQLQALASGCPAGALGSPPGPPRSTSVPRVAIASRSDFDAIRRKGKPAILAGLDIGPCTARWTAAYLEERVGAEREVVVHDAGAAAGDRMMFQGRRNFSYAKQHFGEFVRSAEHGARVYLRSVAAAQPAKRPAELARDFPNIAGDFALPAELAGVAELAHSSPLRISGAVALWLHYDVLANVLCQVRGAKVLRLFPPGHAVRAGVPPGSSSSDVDPFDDGEVARAGLSPRDARLEPGDVLFIPPMWLHAARPEGGFSVAVNVFFRDLEPRYYAPGKDVYGNRDLAAYEAGRRAIEGIARAFDGLPAEIRAFYVDRLAEELRGKGRQSDEVS